MDPRNHNVVYAGTTEGLWKTLDGGKTFARMTATNVVINDVIVDPRDSNRVLLATDRIGLLASNNGATSFNPTNRGFAHRQITSLVADHKDGHMSALSTTRNSVVCSLPGIPGPVGSR
jgi:hypothetical protein